MLKFGHSRLMALGDFKRTWRDDKTTCGVFHWSVKNYRTFRSVSMSTKALKTILVACISARFVTELYTYWDIYVKPQFSFILYPGIVDLKKLRTSR